MKRAGIILLIILELAVFAGAAIGGAGLLQFAGLAEEEEEAPAYAQLYVTADILNGRTWPSKKSPVEAFYDYGDLVQPTGRMSKDREWLEIYGGESGTVWVSIRYVSERIVPFTVTNLNNGRIRIRNKPDGAKTRGYVRNGKSIEIDRVVLGWGHCREGWVDLEYFIEEV